MKEHQLTITVDGDIKFVHDDEIAAGIEAAGRLSKARASHVEPVSWPKRLAFHAIRRLVRDESRVADWTRRWKCQWQARIIGGPVLRGPFQSRAEAIEAEVAWINRNI